MQVPLLLLPSRLALRSKIGAISCRCCVNATWAGFRLPLRPQPRPHSPFALTCADVTCHRGAPGLKASWKIATIHCGPRVIGEYQLMKLRLAHYRNRFSMFRIYYALRAGLVKADGIEVTVVEVPDPPSRELEEILIRGDVDIANVYLPNFLERRLDGAPIVGALHGVEVDREGQRPVRTTRRAAASGRPRGS